MADRHTLDASTALAVHDMIQCRELGSLALRDADLLLPAQLVNQIVLCTAICAVAADELQAGQTSWPSLELCESVCRECADACRPFSDEETLRIYGHIAELCAESIEALADDL